jgi:hypothetical protein
MEKTSSLMGISCKEYLFLLTIEVGIVNYRKNFVEGGQ